MARPLLLFQSDPYTPTPSTVPTMRRVTSSRTFVLPLAAVLGLLAWPASGLGQEADPAVMAVGVGEADPLSARVWLDQGDEAIFQTGDRVRIYYRVSHDAFVSIFQINTDGFARLVYPASPDEDGFTRGGRDYRLLLPQSPYWYVDDAPGVGYYFVVASPTPFDFTHFPYSFSEGGWDLSRVGQNIYTDPYVAMDDFVAALVPQWQEVGYALDFLSYDVGQAHEYPRFLCYECHGYQPYYAWNPYHYSCTSFRLQIWYDPYFYPVYRYAGNTVVWTRPPVPGNYPRFGFKERADGEPGTPEVLRRDPGNPTGGSPPARTDGGDGDSGRGGVGARPVSGPPPGADPLGPARRVGPIGGYRPPTNPPAGRTGRPSGAGAGAGSGTSGEGAARPGGVPTVNTGVTGSSTQGEGRPEARPTRTTTSGTGLSTSNGGRSGAREAVPLRRDPSGTERSGTPPSRPSERMRSTAGERTPTARTGGSSSGRTTFQPRSSTGARTTTPRPSTSRPTTSRPTTSRPTTSRPSAGSRSGASSSRPVVRPRPSGGSSSRPSARPSTSGSRPPTAKPKTGGSSGSRPAVKPKKPKGGGGAAPSPRRPGGS